MRRVADQASAYQGEYPTTRACLRLNTRSGRNSRDYALEPRPYFVNRE